MAQFESHRNQFIGPQLGPSGGRVRSLGREPINLQGRRHARVRYASIADVLLHSSATTLRANERRVRSADDLSDRKPTFTWHSVCGHA